MKAEIITIGDELLIGQVINTNTAYIAEKLNGVGISVERMTIVGDKDQEILDAFKEAYEKYDVVCVTGGLGPTHDDVTKKVVCKFFNTDLVMNEEALVNVKRLLKSRNMPLTKLNEEQALVPRTCTVIRNPHGTAPGMFFDQNKKYFIVMPGVPYEMKAMMENFVVPHFSKRASGSAIRHRTLKTTGIAESFLAQQLGNLDELLQGAKLAFLPASTGVRLRITVQEKYSQSAERKIQEVEKRIRAKAEKYIYGVDDEELEQVIGKLLTKKKLKIAVAESCTGGLIADRITNVPGSSNYFERGVIAYSNQSKVDLLGVPQELIEKHGAVSREVAEAMAEGVRKISSANIGISTTGIAGPTGGTPEKPVGLAWIGYSDNNGTFALKFNFGEDRLRVKERAAQAALELTRRRILKIN